MNNTFEADHAEEFYFGQCENPIAADFKYGRELWFTRLREKAPTARGKRGKVYNFSPASARRFRTCLRRRGIELTHFVTITFPPELFYTFGGFKRYVRHFWLDLARELRRRGISYIWVREPQKNGRPHYHVMCQQGEVVRLLAARINRRYLTKDRAFANLRRGIQCKGIYAQRGAEHYLAKLSSYCVKATAQHRDDGWRHWARNFRDDIPEQYEASAKQCDWLRSNYTKFYQFKFPMVISIPKEIPTGPPLPW